MIHSCYFTSPQLVVIPGSSVVIAQQSAAIAQQYQTWKVHDKGYSEHPKLQESTQYSQSYSDLKKVRF